MLPFNVATSCDVNANGNGSQTNMADEANAGSKARQTDIQTVTTIKLLMHSKLAGGGSHRHSGAKCSGSFKFLAYFTTSLVSLILLTYQSQLPLC